MRKSIEENLNTWETSVRRLSPRARPPVRNRSGHAASVIVWQLGRQRHDDNDDEVLPSEPRVLLYAWHIFHCLYIVLYGKLDLVCMFHDTDWLLSNDFLVATDHASKCVRVRQTLFPHPFSK